MKWRLLRTPIEREDDVVAVRQRARLLAERLGLSRQEQTSLATAVSEIARNAYGYAKGGIADFGIDEEQGRQRLVVRISDEGPGIADLGTILDGRYVSTTGMGLGVVGARRLADTFDVRSERGNGTAVTLGKWLPHGHPALGGPDIAALSALLRRERDADPQQAVRAQNRDLLQSLSDLAEKEEETRRLHAELREAHASLERRVVERTAELARANERLEEAAVARERVEGELRQAQKMEAVGQLTGGIAHDFNNLLTGITGSLDLLRMRMRQGRHEDAERFVETAIGSATRAAALTHRLLAFSRPQPLAPEPTDANAVILGLENLLRSTIPATVVLRVGAGLNLWPTLCDVHQLENVVLNLCINARDAMPRGGTLSLETSNEHLDEAYVAAHPSATSGDHACIRVTDTGTGMSPEVLARVFEPFFTTKPVGKGTGLGLAMVYGFARQSKGHCRIVSEVGRGTTILLYLPRHVPPPFDADASLVTSPVHAAPPGCEADILLVEQDPVARDLADEVLRDMGHRVIRAEDGAAALRRLAEGGVVDLVVTDIALSGGVGGHDLAVEARAMRPGLKVLFITGHAGEIEAARSTMLPGVEILSKPFQIQALAEKVSRLLTARHLWAEGEREIIDA